MARKSEIGVICLRWALGVTFLSAVADRFGLWGPPGSYASWGDWAHFLTYSRSLNWLLPTALQSPIAIMATALETLFGLTLIVGYKIRYMALGACILLCLFAIAMSTAASIKSPLNYSVFVDAAAAFLLYTITT
jgi:uncharacterized membrane protein YphA (DoxX/SURF4 family)